ncbi:recombinase family protein [Lysobacter sp. TAF61]|uniref:recombinase family protein n=1 Tax=Lysobacter sp. TAF61 TaxID=3233072 RepID=UPI003F9C19E6
MPPRFVAYFRVSTAAQGQSGLGLEAQRSACEAAVAATGGILLDSFEEIGSRGDANRPALGRAMAFAKLTRATLIAARLDRFGEGHAILAALEKSGVEFAGADGLHDSDLVRAIKAAVSKEERQKIKARTVAALAAKREALAALNAADGGGRRLGNPNGAAALRRASKGNLASNSAQIAKAEAFALTVRPYLLPLEGLSMAKQAAALNERGILTRAGGRWYAASVKSVRDRLASLDTAPR